MTCCGSAAGLESFSGCSPDEIQLASRDLGGGLRQSVFSVPGMHCGACISAVEKTLSNVKSVRYARANLTQRRVTVHWTESEGAPDIGSALNSAGYEANIPDDNSDGEDRVQAHLVRALAVAGFSSMNIMLFAVSVWAGADDGTRHAFQMFSAVLAAPAVIYSGSSFYASAWRALSHGRLNMDVPISAGVLLSFALSLYDATTNAAQAYFEASTSLLFVLLAGRLLDHMMRRKARSAAAGLARLIPPGANLVADDGSISYVPLSDVGPGARLLVAAGMRAPTDGRVVKGRSEVDSSMISGESIGRTVGVGDRVKAGELNLGGPFEFEAQVAPENSTLSKMSRLLAAAEDSRTGYRKLADRAASLYAPVVHSLSGLAFFAWLYISGDFHRAMTIAIAVLVITCPCALGLAVPMVQVALTRRLYDNGVLAVDGNAFERLARVDTVVFDKTGTLTTGYPSLNDGDYRPEHLAVAGTLASHSTHPYARALAAAHQRAGGTIVAFDQVEEIAGFGLEGRMKTGFYRLGKPGWAHGDVNVEGGVVLSLDGIGIAEFSFSETTRPGAAALVSGMAKRGIEIILLSGDFRHAVARVATELGLKRQEAEMLPAEKAEFVRALKERGRTVLMVGDGVNDAAALRTADVSMAPSTASDIGRSASDFVFLGGNLSAVAETIATSRVAMALVRQNFALAALYNAASLPLAFSGYVTPLMAALAMSTSSILVVLNSLRLAVGQTRQRERIQPAAVGLPV